MMKSKLFLLTAAIVTVAILIIACNSTENPKEADDTEDTFVSISNNNNDNLDTFEPDEDVRPLICPDDLVKLTIDGYSECVTPKYYLVATKVLPGRWENMNFNETITIEVHHVNDSNKMKKQCPPDTKFYIRELPLVKRICVEPSLSLSLCKNEPMLCTYKGYIKVGSVVESDGEYFIHYTVEDNYYEVSDNYSLKKISSN